jgi:hypothetical protein
MVLDYTIRDECWCKNIKRYNKYIFIFRRYIKKIIIIIKFHKAIRKLWNRKAIYIYRWLNIWLKRLKEG